MDTPHRFPELDWRAGPAELEPETVRYCPISGRPQSMAISPVSLVYLVVALFAYLYSQGGTTLVISELYLGRTTTIAESLRNISGDLWYLLGRALWLRSGVHRCPQGHFYSPLGV